METAQHSTRPPAVPASEFLAAKLHGLRKKVLAHSALTAASVALLVGVEVLALAMFFDWWLELPRGLRALLLAGQVVGLGWLLGKYAIAPIFAQPSDEQLALAVEKARPQLRTRLIASVQLTQGEAVSPGMSRILIDALVEETEAIAANIDFRSIVSSERLRAIGIAAGCVLLVGIAAFTYGRPTTTQLLKRAVLQEVPVPRKTRVHIPASPVMVGRGDHVRIEAFATGLIPRTGWLDVRMAGRATQRQLMESQGGTFSRTIENVQDSFEYQVRLNDGRSPWTHVKVLPRPTVAAISCEQRFPAYTGLPGRKPATADLSLLAGSQITLRVIPSTDIATANIRLVGPGSNVPMRVVAPRELEGAFRVPAKGMTGFAVDLVDTNGLSSANSAVYRIDILPDKPPAVRITAPTRREELFTRQAIASIGMEVTDEFQIARVRLRYKGDATDDAGAKAIDLDIGTNTLRALQHRFEWNMSSVATTMGAGSRLEYWIEAEDNNDVTGPGIGASERHFARLVTDEEKRADLWNRASDTLSGINDLASDQEKLNQALGTLIREKADAHPQKE